MKQESSALMIICSTLTNWPRTAVQKLKLPQLQLTKLKTYFKVVLSKTASGRNLVSFNRKYEKIEERKIKNAGVK